MSEKETNAKKEVKEINELLSADKRRKDEIQKKIDFIDLDDVEIEKSDIAAQQESLKSIFDARPSVSVTCSQSGYSAKVTGLFYKDIVTITNSSLTNYDNKREIYKIMYSKIIEFSAEKWHPTFDEWLKATSIGDVETLFYGLYCSTFQEKSVIRYECPFCGETCSVTVDNQKLLRADDAKEMMELSNSIRTEAKTVDKINEFSLVNNKKENIRTVKLPDSKIIFSIKIPTLYRTLEILRKFSDEELANKSTDAVNVMLSAYKVAIPVVDTNKYSFIENDSDIFQLLDILSPDDFAVLKEVVNSLLDSKHVSYYLEKEKCNSCGKAITKIPLDMEGLLFFQISEKQLL